MRVSLFSVYPPVNLCASKLQKGKTYILQLQCFIGVALRIHGGAIHGYFGPGPKKPEAPPQKFQRYCGVRMLPKFKAMRFESYWSC